MATKTMNVRVSGKRDTLANWTNNNPVLLSGEVVQVIMTDGTLRHKTGNGTNTFTQLSYDDEIAAMPKWFSDDYDTDKDGIVDNAEKLGGQLPSYYAKATDIPNVPSWAMNSTKPTYTPSEVGAAAAEHTHEQGDISGLTTALAGKAPTEHTHEQADITGLSNALAGKVNVQSGKGLSTNDYTTTEKNKLAGIAAGANNYTHPTTHPASMITGLSSVATSGDYADLSGKPTIPTVDSALSSTSTNPVQNKAIQAALASKVNTESGKGLSSNDYTTTEKNKLAGIATGANNYTHPSTHPASMITGLSTVATSGNYNDLSGKPVIPVITSGTEELTPGESPLADGVVYLQYE